MKKKHRSSCRCIAGFIMPYKCCLIARMELNDFNPNKMRAKKGRVRLSPNEEAQLIKEETEKRRKLRLQQVREQCKENATKVRTAVKREKHKQLMKLATDLKGQLEDEKEERVRHLEQQYENSLRSIGVGHKQAVEQPDWSEERELLVKAENLRAEARGREALERLRTETAVLNEQANRHIKARKAALMAEKERSAEVAAMPPPPPDPLTQLDKNRKPVKVTDMNAFTATHYHLVNEHAVDRADVAEQNDAREAAEIEAERIRERAMELKRLRQDQLERARLRHNVALEKELLKHDYDNILHDLSDLQRADRERRLKIVHTIPKQVFEPPNVRMEDREDKQKQMEQDFEDMYMAGTDNMGDISMAFDPYPRPMTPTGTASLDVTVASEGTPLQLPTLPAVLPVLRDMTNKPKSPGKKPEKVLRQLMNRIKSQREEWVTSRSMIDVGEGEKQPGEPRPPLPQGQAMDDGQFKVLRPEQKSPVSVEQSPPEKLARVHSPAEATGGAFQHPPSQYPMGTVDRVQMMQQQTNVPFQPRYDSGCFPSMEPQTRADNQPGSQQGADNQIQQQQGLHAILKQQELILEQKQQLEEKLKELNAKHQELQSGGKTAPVPTLAQSGGSQGSQVPPQQFASSMSSSGMSTQPMNSIPPSASTNTGPISTMTHMQQQSNVNFPPYQPLPRTTAQIGHIPPYPTAATMATMTAGYQGVALPQQQAPMQVVVTSDAHNEQLRKVKEYQQYLLQRHEQSKKVLDETKAEIKRRRENLLQRYPQLDLSRLEDLGAKYLQNGVETTVPLSGQPQPAVARATATSAAQGLCNGIPLQGQPVSSLVASLAAHPYYASTLDKPLTSKVITSQTQPEPPSQWTVGAINAGSSIFPADVNLGRKSPFDPVRKSLPFDADESLQSPSVRVYDAFSSKQVRQPDASTSLLLTYGQKGRGGQSLDTSTDPDSSGLDTSTSVSFMSDKHDQTGARKDELQRQLADIQRQKEEILQIHQLGQQRLLMKQDQLKAKLSSQTQEQLQQSLRDVMREKEEIARQYEAQITSYGKDGISDSSYTDDSLTSSKADVSIHSAEEEFTNRINWNRDLPTILEMDTPASTRPSEGSGVLTGRLSNSSSDGTASLSLLKSARSQKDDQSFENVETMMQREKTAAGSQQANGQEYGNVEEILKRAKQFENEVLEKLRRQTNPVFETILEHEDSAASMTNRRVVGGMSLSSGSLSDSLSTGPLDGNSMTSRSRSRSRDGLDEKSVNGSFQGGKSWAAELSTYKVDSRSDGSSGFMPLKTSDSDRSSMGSQGQGQQEHSTVFDAGSNRFKIYSSLAQDADQRMNATGSTGKEDTSINSTLSDAGLKKNLTASDMLQHLRDLQKDLKSGEEARFMLERELLARKLLEKHSPNQSQANLSQYSFPNQTAPADLTQFSVTDSDRSKDLSTEAADGSEEGGVTSKGRSQDRSGRPVRRSPIGDLLKEDSRTAVNHKHEGGPGDVSLSDYSFSLTEDKQRSTSTPGDQPRTRSSLDNSTPKSLSDFQQTSAVNRSELPSEITAGERTANDSSSTHQGRLQNIPESRELKDRDQSSSKGDLSDYSVSTQSNQSRDQQQPGQSFDKAQLAQDLTSYSVSSNDDSTSMPSSNKPLQFHRLSPVAGRQAAPPPPPPPPSQPSQKVQTFAVTRQGDLIPDNQKAQFPLSAVAKRQQGSSSNNFSADHSRFSMSGQVETSLDESDGQKTNRGESDVSRFLNNFKTLQTDSDGSGFSASGRSFPGEHSRARERTSVGGHTSDTKSSSSFTTVTSDPMLNFTGGSGTLSQYTLKSNDLTQNPLENSHDQTPSVSSSYNETNNAVNLVQERFASLDQLISDSKSIIARHKVIIGKNKQLEEGGVKKMNEEFDVPPPLPAKGPPPAVKPKTWLKSPNQSLDQTGSELSGLSSFDTSNRSNNNSSSYYADNQASRSQNKSTDQSSNVDTNSLEYLVAHSSGITDEPLPDLSTLGSDMSLMSVGRGDISDSEDSLRSFEKHERSDTESLSNSQIIDDDSFFNSRTEEAKEADLKAIQNAFALKRQKFLSQAQPDQRLTSMKDHVQGKQGTSKESNDHPVFRAIPVAVVAEPTLSMSVKVSSSSVQRGRSPTPMDIKSSQSVKDAKMSFEAKEKEIKASMSPSPLNRALLPRGTSPVRGKDSGSHPRESSIPVPISPASGTPPKIPSGAGIASLAGAIRDFGGSAGLSSKQPSLRADSKQKSTPPALKPKSQRSEVKQGQGHGHAGVGGKSATSGLTKTLSSWKKSRSLGKPSNPSAAALSLNEPDDEGSKPKNSIRVLPEEAPEPLTEEERRKKMEREVYERNMRAYNPRLFRLAHKLDNDDDDKDTSGESGRSDRSEEARKKPNTRRKKAKSKK